MEISASDWSHFEKLLKEVETAYKAPEGSFLKRSELLKRAIEEFIPDFLALNEQINLTAIDSEEGVLWKHFYDSLLVLKLAPKGTILDWGSGGGFPGVPILFFRELVAETREPVILLDSRGKKMRAVNELIVGLGHEDIECVHARGEEFIQARKIDSVVMRAVAPPKEAARWIHARVPHWYFFATPDQAPVWIGESHGLSSRGFHLRENLEEMLPNSLGKRNILHYSR